MAKNKKNDGRKIDLSLISHEDGLLSFYNNAILALVALSIFIIPLFFEIHSFDQFEMPKLVFLRILTIGMLLLWGAKIIYTGKFVYTPTPLDIPLVLWVFMNVVCTIFSISPSISFRGEYENFAGSLSNINYVVIYFIVSQNIKASKQVMVINAALLISCVLLTIYSIAQYFGYDFIKWNEASVIKGRYFASMGNPNFLGAVLIMMMPVEIAYFMIAWKNKKLSYALLIFILFIMSYMALFGTQSRGPFLGFVFSLLFMAGYGIYSVFKGLKNDTDRTAVSKNKIFSFIISKYKGWLIGFSIVLLIVGMLSFSFGKAAAERIWSSVTHIKTSLQISRLHIWVPAIKMIKTNPFLGTGVDTFKTVFPQYSGTNFAQIDGANVSSRTAHNELLNIAATMGLFSLGIYILLLIAYIRMWFMSFKRIETYPIKILSLAMFAAFVAYFTQNLFSFGVAAINTILYIFMGLHFVLFKETNPVKVFEYNLYKKDNSLKIVLLLVVICGACFFIAKTYSVYEADVHYNRGNIYGNVYNKWDVALEEQKTAVLMEPNEVKFHVYLGLAYEQLGVRLENKEQQVAYISEAIKEYEIGTKLNPGNSYYWGNLARAYSLLANISDHKYVKNAVLNYRKAIEKAPVTGLFYYNLIELLCKTGGINEALPEVEKLVACDKDLGAQACFNIGNILSTSNYAKAADGYYRRAVDLKPEYAEAWFNLGVINLAMKNTTEAKEFFKKAYLLNPSLQQMKGAKKIKTK